MNGFGLPPKTRGILCASSRLSADAVRHDNAHYTPAFAIVVLLPLEIGVVEPFLERDFSNPVPEPIFRRSARHDHFALCRSQSYS